MRSAHRPLAQRSWAARSDSALGGNSAGLFFRSGLKGVPGHALVKHPCRLVDLARPATACEARGLRVSHSSMGSTSRLLSNKVGNLMVGHRCMPEHEQMHGRPKPPQTTEPPTWGWRPHGSGPRQTCTGLGCSAPSAGLRQGALRRRSGSQAGAEAAGEGPAQCWHRGAAGPGLQPHSGRWGALQVVGGCFMHEEPVSAQLTGSDPRLLRRMTWT